MLHSAKKAFFSSLAALCMSGSAWGQSTISFTTNSAPAGSSFVPITLNTFDTSLGTLTGVTVTINFTSIQGTFVVTTSDEPAVLNSVSVTPVIRQSTNTMGFTTVSNIFDVSGLSTPSVPANLAPNTVNNFVLSSTNVYIGSSSSISSNFWSAYQSAGPSNVTFEIRTIRSFNIDGEGAAGSGVGITSSANMSVTYTYTSAEPIPEPSTVAAGAFLTVLAAASYWRRRRSAR